MKVSIVIPNYNGKKYLIVCLSSLLRQTIRDFEIIIVDNASVDGSKEFIKLTYPNIKLICLEKNYGFSKAVNEGIKSALGEYVVLLNNDTETTEDWLSNLLQCIEKDKRIFSCSSKMLRYDERNIIDDAGDDYTLMAWAYKRGDGVQAHKIITSKRIFSSCAGAAIYRRDVFDKIGYFDEEFFAYMEDVDVGYRANIHGYKNVFCPNAIVYHIGSATSGSKYNSFKVKLAARNNILVVLKNMPLIQIIINSPFLLLGFFVKYIFFRNLGFSKEYIEGIKEAVLIYKKIWKEKIIIGKAKNYIEIQFLMIKNTVKYLFKKIINL